MVKNYGLEAEIYEKNHVLNFFKILAQHRMSGDQNQENDTFLNFFSVFLKNLLNVYQFLGLLVPPSEFP